MTLRGYMAAPLLVCLLAPLAVAQSGTSMPAAEQHARLGDIMIAVQLRHMKLWFAGKAGNWQLADYELSQLEAGLMEAATLYLGNPTTNIAALSKPAQAIADAIEARDSELFAKAVEDFTDGCNACHQSIGRGFIVIRVPTESPFGNQVFPPREK